ncbi:sulfatase [Chitinophagaceae bacterium LB-8]|uniref:Sulfatase n=1 Tax=Paraflavisolibacter caeni TaxID=2982496 RepID=A0A9X3BAG8_9BACT|nr:sulfatase [Paraflavisolibacter caeni]MCU7552756.1 sulfatase [Paraflavisolibacter caeni]
MRIFFSALFLLWIVGITNAQRPKAPNVIIVYFDDMGYGDIEPFGMTGIPMPSFNRLASEGTRMTHFNAAQPVCSASRSALMTGCYPNRIGISGALLPGSKIALNPEEETIASILKKAGYKTAMVGKWHLGDKAPYLPLHYGFDSFLGLPWSHDIWPRDHQGNLITDPKDIRFTWPELVLLDGDKVIDTIKSFRQQQGLTRLFTDKAVSFIKENKRTPFFLYLAQPMPHVPLAPSEKFRGKSELGPFGDVMMELDWSIGEILKALDHENLSNNTLLIVTSDNGPWLNYGDHAGSPGGFREGKNSTFEGGTRVPLFMRWPGKIEAGRTYSDLMTNMDLLPTIAAAAGASLPKKPIDGLNFLPSITNKNTRGPREVFYYYFEQNSLQAIRFKNWKLVLPHKSVTYLGAKGIGGKGNPVSKKDFPLALYDLAHDPSETYDVQHLYPEMVQKLMGIAEQAREDLGDQLTNRQGKNRRPAAVVNSTVFNIFLE